VPEDIKKIYIDLTKYKKCAIYDIEAWPLVGGTKKKVKNKPDEIRSFFYAQSKILIS